MTYSQENNQQTRDSIVQQGGEAGEDQAVWQRHQPAGRRPQGTEATSYMLEENDDISGLPSGRIMANPSVKYPMADVVTDTDTNDDHPIGSLSFGITSDQTGEDVSVEADEVEAAVEVLGGPPVQLLPQPDGLDSEKVRRTMLPASTPIKDSWLSADAGWPLEREEISWGPSVNPLDVEDPYSVTESRIMIKPRQWSEKRGQQSEFSYTPPRPVQIKPRRWQDEVEETSAKPVQMRPVQIKRRPDSQLPGTDLGNEEQSGTDIESTSKGQRRSGVVGGYRQGTPQPTNRASSAGDSKGTPSAILKEDRRRLDRRPVTDQSQERSTSLAGNVGYRQRPQDTPSNQAGQVTERNIEMGTFVEPAESNFQRELLNLRRKSFNREISLGREVLKDKSSPEKDYAIPKSFKNFKETYSLQDRKKEEQVGPFFTLDSFEESKNSQPFVEVQEPKSSPEGTTSSPMFFLPTMNPETPVVLADEPEPTSVLAVHNENEDKEEDKEDSQTNLEEEEIETTENDDFDGDANDFKIGDNEEVDAEESLENSSEEIRRGDDETGDPYEETSTDTNTVKSMNSMRNLERMKDIELKEKISEIGKQANNENKYGDDIEEEDDDESSLYQLRNVERNKDLEVINSLTEATVITPTQSPFFLNRIRSGTSATVATTDTFTASMSTTGNRATTSTTSVPLGNLSDENEYSKTHLRLQKIRARTDSQKTVKVESVTQPPSVMDTTIMDITGPEENRYSKTHITQMKTKKNNDKKTAYEDVHVKDIIKKIPVAKLNKLLKKSGFVVSDLFRKEPEALDIVLNAMKNNDFSGGILESEQDIEEPDESNVKQGTQSDRDEDENRDLEKEEKMADDVEEGKIKIPWPKAKEGSSQIMGDSQEDDSNRKTNYKKEKKILREKETEEALDKEVDNMDVKSLMKSISPMSLSEVLQKVGFTLPDVMQSNKAAIKAVLKFHRSSMIPQSQSEDDNSRKQIQNKVNEEEDNEESDSVSEEGEPRKKWQPSSNLKPIAKDNVTGNTTAKWKPFRSDSPKPSKTKQVEVTGSTTTANPPRWQPSTTPSTVVTEASDEPGNNNSGGKTRSAVDLFKKFRKNLSPETTVKTTESENMVTPPNDFQKFGERTTRKRFGSLPPSLSIEEAIGIEKEQSEKTTGKDHPRRLSGNLSKLSEKVDDVVDNEEEDEDESTEANYEDSEENDDSAPDLKYATTKKEFLTSPSTVDSLNATLSNLNMTVDDLKERKDDLSVPGIEKIFKDFQKEKDTDIVYGEKKVSEKTVKDKPKQFIQTDFGSGGFRQNSQPWGGIGFGYGSMGSGLITNRLTSTTTRSPNLNFDLNGDMIEETVDVLSQDNRDLLGDYKVLDYQDASYDNPYEDYANGEVPVGVKSALIASSVVGGFAVREVLNLLQNYNNVNFIHNDQHI